MVAPVCFSLGLKANGLLVAFSRAWIPKHWTSIGEWIGANLEVDHLGTRPFSSLAVEGRAVTPGGPHSLPFPSGLWIVEASVHPFGKKAHRIGYAQYREFAVHQSDQQIGRIACNDRRVLAEPQSIEAIHPDVIMRVGAARVWHIFELRPRGWIQH